MQLNDTEKIAFEISKKMKGKLGDRISPTQIFDVVDDASHRAFKIKFVAYDYFIVLFNYELDIIGCSIEQGKTYIPLSHGRNCYSDNNFDDFFAGIRNELELRIPDKFLKARGWM